MTQDLCSPIQELPTLVGLLRLIRRAVSVPSDMHVDLVVKLDLLPKLSAFLDIDCSEIRKEVVLIMANIAACATGSYVNLMLSTGAQHKLVEILASPGTELKEPVRFRPHDGSACGH